MSSWALEGDGPIESLYHLLWRKNVHMESCPGVRLPDTVIYKYRQPAYWYFTSTQDGQLKKKARGNQGNNKIIEGFTKSNSCDIVAYYISTHLTKTHEKKEEKITTIEYFDARGLHDFLHNRDKIDNGFLQAFIPPKGRNHSIIRATWSPQVFMLERRVNNCNLNDRKFDMYERAATYEGAEDQSQLAPVTAKKLVQDLQAICNSIVQHIAVTSPHHLRISRMVCNFKLDAHERIWFLWCSSLRLMDKFTGKTAMPVPLELGELLLPAKQWNPAQIQGQIPPICKAQFFKCPNCTKTVAHRCKCQITYKLAVVHYNPNKAYEICRIPTPAVTNDGNGNPVQENNSDDKSEESDEEETAGVGLGGLKIEMYYPDWIPTADDSAEGVEEEEEEDPNDPIRIPPVVMAQHKKMKLAQFRKLMFEQQFLFNSCFVCEDCCMDFNKSATDALAKEKFSEMQVEDVDGPKKTHHRRTTHLCRSNGPTSGGAARGGWRHLCQRQEANQQSLFHDHHGSPL